jgi:2-succinyl-5-enolpyruvyl-6-hydroxy-3-cyclohexene-1-carboxylate synthase
MVHTDERGAAFYAVGHAKATRNPVALICTSGTAAANYLPAVVEASYSRTPLIALTADRPAELQDTGSNQTIDQANIYAKFVRFSFDLPVLSDDTSPEFVLTTIDQAVYRSRRSPSGPVHINCRFAEPLISQEDDSIIQENSNRLRHWKECDTPYTTYNLSLSVPDESLLEDVRSRLVSSKRGLIVVGGLSPSDDTSCIHDLAAHLRLPLVACVSSGLRFGHERYDSLITCHDLFLQCSGFVERYRPDVILHLGGSVVSKHLMEYIRESRADYIVVNDTPFRQDPIHSVTMRVEANPADFCRSIADFKPAQPSELLTPLISADKLCRDLVSELHTAPEFSNELQIVSTVLDSLPDRCGLFLANSMPIRDADACGFVSTRLVAVAVNRGASGIDGNIATAAGFAAGIGRPTVALVGDLAFLHDLNSLSLISRSSVPITVVVINNNGGGIFSMLPVSEYDIHFEKLFGTPHGLTFKKAAELFDLKYFKPSSPVDLHECCNDAFSSGRSAVIEVCTDRRTNASEHRKLFARVKSEIDKLI